MASARLRICRKSKIEVKNVFEATLKNRISAHFAPVTITFPIPEDQYEQAILALEKSQIGDARVQDCLIDNVHAPNCPALVRMTGTMANVDELDWLGKQLESFDRYELLQFNAAVERFGLSAADELIDLSFCARDVTVVSDFNDLELVGKRHYHRTVDIQPGETGTRALLHFGAVDYHAKVWVNGAFAGEHYGGHSSFYLDITGKLANGSNEVTVMAEDTKSCEQPRGKQIWGCQPERCWYTETTGIWQPVWIDFVGNSYFESIHILTDIDKRSVEISACWFGNQETTVECRVSFHGKLLGNVRRTTSERTTKCLLEIPEIDPIEEFHYWSPDNPMLFDVQMVLRTEQDILDCVSSYFGMRKISVENGKIMLNNRPLYQKLILDQGYWADSLMTATSEEDFISDIKIIKKMGFNGVRMHQKIEDPRFLYWADKLGLLVWEEMPSAYVFSEQAVTNVISEWQEIIRRDYNHPSIIVWAPLNESWGVRNIYSSEQQQNYAKTLYYLTKTIDPTRLVSTNDGWEQVTSDICSVHDYWVNGESMVEKYADLKSLLASSAQGKMLYAKGYAWKGEPIILSEFGGRAIGKVDGWGYSSNLDSTESFTQHYGSLIQAVLQNPLIQGFCYTQLTDVMQEKNGLLDENHCPKIDIKEVAKSNRIVQQ